MTNEEAAWTVFPQYSLGHRLRRRQFVKLLDEAEERGRVQGRIEGAKVMHHYILDIGSWSHCGECRSDSYGCEGTGWYKEVFEIVPADVVKEK